MEISRDVLRSIVRDDLMIEQASADRLRANLLKARNELQAHMNKNPNDLHPVRMSSVLDEYLGYKNISERTEFPLKSIYEHGLEEGKLITGLTAEIPKDSAYWSWTPQIPVNAIGFADSEFTASIIKASDALKTNVLREVQVGLALGASNEDIMDRVFGVGIRGAKGRDGAFRSTVTRLETIARTVTNDLINRGALATYQQVDQLCPELKLQKIWQSLSDSRTTPICIELSGQVKPLNEHFTNGVWSGANPPAHPNCRSRVTCLSERYMKIFEERFKSTSNVERPPLKDELKRASKASAESRMYKPTKIPAETMLGGNPRFTPESIDKMLSGLPPDQHEVISTMIAKNRLQIATPLRKWEEPNMDKIGIPDPAAKLAHFNKLNKAYQESLPDIQKYIEQVNQNANLKMPVKAFLDDGKTPLTMGQTALPKHGANGSTAPYQRFIKVSTFPGAKEFNPDMRSLTVSTSEMLKVSNAAHLAGAKNYPIGSFQMVSDYNSDRRIAGTMLHELGHQADWMNGDLPIPQGARFFTDQSTGFGDPNKARSEWHAEGFRLWATNPDEFKEYDPIGFQHIDAVARRAATRPDQSSWFML